jgi:uncharacterized RDD family membrane protein YckC
MQPLIQPSVTATRYAGFSVRTAAFIIDVLITGVLATIISRIFFGNYYPRFEGDTDPGPGAVSLIINWLYFAYQESSVRQSTIGKAAMGLKVCTENGERLSFAKATGRFFAKMLSAAILFIGFIMVAFNDRRQGLHDKLAKTLVIYQS